MFRTGSDQPGQQAPARRNHQGAVTLMHQRRRNLQGTLLNTAAIQCRQQLTHCQGGGYLHPPLAADLSGYAVRLVKHLPGSRQGAAG